MTAQATPYQIELLQHTLGLSEQRRESYRNYFVAGHGHSDMRHLEALERSGLMERRRSPAFLADGDIVFAATDAGREAAIAALPAPRKRTKADDWRDRDGCESFGEFLCGRRLPQIETRREFKQDPRRSDVNDLVWVTEHRMFRLHRNDWAFSTERDVQGEWMPTKKDAKASYKAALKARASSEATHPNT
ncbi:hypothetical protein [Paraburkholderia domus]|uniref:hypothetical protein n=1 Tax=Paraburkholderia domus TaxID=2793075 RepID=UPI0019134FBA|nr:hypothetical protein [Paraburkholderia domus]MBK5061757.1 hypothetical protein [Burkholderia sp. R-70199]CAE6899891.1 hypothetical protein R70199_03631 [Paraburkholderia domus]